MSAFGGKADMTVCGKSAFAVAIGGKADMGPVPYWTRVHLDGEAGKLDTRWNFRMEGGDVSPPCTPSLCANQQRGGIDGHQDRVAGT